MLGATREVEALYAIFRGFKHHYTRAELNAAEEEYWQRRLTRQAMQDVIAHGRVAAGNQDALRQIGMPVAPQPDYLRSVEQRFLLAGDVRIVVVVPTLISREEIQRGGLRCLEGWTIPGSFQWQIHVVDGRPVERLFMAAIPWE